jgi:Leucine-rich repeat (LRR) protein
MRWSVMFVVMFVLLAVAWPAVAAIPQSERDALIALYDSTNGDSWVYKTNWLGPVGTECTWMGVACNAESHVATIYLAVNNLTGVLPPAIGDLTELELFDVNTNGNLGGVIPDEIQYWTKIKVINLSSTKIGGPLPEVPWLHMPLLEKLFLQGLPLTGGLPESLGSLTHLTELRLIGTHIGGELPEALGNLAELRSLFLGENQFVGQIPDELGDLHNLEYLVLNNNPGLSSDLYRDDGTSWLDGMPNLRWFIASQSNLFGTIPADFGAMTQLEYLDLRFNQFSGEIPPALGNLTNLQNIYLNNNRLTGPIPPEFGNLVHLKNLWLHDNQLTGGIPWQLGNMTELQGMALMDNPFLGGEIPPELGNLTSLRELYLSKCGLEGPIPWQLGNLTELWRIHLNNQHLSGSIPPELGNLAKADTVALGCNELTGEIPVSFGNLAGVVALNLHENHLSGQIPPELGNLLNLKALVLYGNKLEGPVPFELTQLVNLQPGWLFLNNNALYTADQVLRDFLNSKQNGGDWERSQTIAPTDVVVGAIGPDSVELSWTPIRYTENTGGYRVLYSTSPGGPYELFGITENKSVSSKTVTGLEDGVAYFFVVQAVTYPHSGNPNTVESELSAEVSATTIALNQPPVVEAGSGLAGVEGQLVGLSSTFVDPDPDDTHAAVIDWGDGTVDSGVVSEAGGSGTVSGTHAYVEDGWYTVTVTVTDDSGDSGVDTTTVDVANAAPVVGVITAPVDPVQLGLTVTASAGITDPGVLDTHVATWAWGDGTSTSGTVTESGGAGTVTGSHLYAMAGVYAVTLTVTDDEGAAGEAHFRYVVVYDPDGGFVTGGGWITSPPGAYVPDPTLTGRANFGFVSKYRHGASVPTGTTEFQFHAAGFNFRSTSYQWLVVAGAKAKFKGEGEINGGGSYGFMLSATDGALPGGGGSDKFRIKIWDKATDVVVYDNELGAPDDADPTTVIGGGSIVIHQN